MANVDADGKFDMRNELQIWRRARCPAKHKVVIQGAADRGGALRRAIREKRITRRETTKIIVDTKEISHSILKCRSPSNAVCDATCCTVSCARLSDGGLHRRLSGLGALRDPAIYEVGSDPALGFNLISWWNFDNSGTPNVDEGVAVWQNAVQTLYDAGFREVSISPVRYFDTTTFSIAQTSGQGPLLTSIDAGVAKAKQLGMRVTINPFVEPSGSSNWRGTYDPAGTAATTFWSDYQNYMVAVAQIAQAHNVDAMTIGTELKAMDDDANNASHWSSVINAVSGVYQGPLGYSANWDDYRNTSLTSSIWQNPKISFIGIDSYFNNLLYDYYKYQNPSLTTTQITTMVNNATNPIQSYPDQSFIDLMTAAWNKMLDVDSPTVSSGGHTYFNLDGILPFAASLG